MMEWIRSSHVDCVSEGLYTSLFFDANMPPAASWLSLSLGSKQPSSAWTISWSHCVVPTQECVAVTRTPVSLRPASWNGDLDRELWGFSSVRTENTCKHLNILVFSPHCLQGCTCPYFLLCLNTKNILYSHLKNSRERSVVAQPKVGAKATRSCATPPHIILWRDPGCV